MTVPLLRPKRGRFVMTPLGLQPRRTHERQRRKMGGAAAGVAKINCSSSRFCASNMAWHAPCVSFLASAQLQFARIRNTYWVIIYKRRLDWGGGGTSKSDRVRRLFWIECYFYADRGERIKHSENFIDFICRRPPTLNTLSVWACTLQRRRIML